MIDKSSTTLMQMPNATVEDIWLPQKSKRDSYHHPVPPDVVPQYQDKMDWHTIPRGVAAKKKSVKRAPRYENVAIGVKPKDYIELTKTVKNSLILSKKEAMLPPEEVDAPMHTTYKMPPLTPTVANLIHTSSVVNKSFSKVGSKVMKPVSTDSPIDETGYLVNDGPEEYKNRSFLTRDHRSRSRNYSRACVMRDRTITYEDDQPPTRPSRYSWTSAPDESTPNFRKPSISSTYSAGRVSLQSERMFSIGSKGSMPPKSPKSSDRNAPSNYYPKVIQHYSAGYSPQLNSTSVQEQSTSFGKSLSRRPSNAPPPPPRRSPSTKLTKSPHSRKESVSSSNSQSSSSSCRKLSDHFASGTHSADDLESSPEDELPDLPPRLPLYDPSTRARHDSPPNINPNLIKLPAPPPPPPQMLPGRQPSISPNPEGEDPDYDFPPPPLM